MKIPRTLTKKAQFWKLAKSCKATPTLDELNQLEDLLETERSSVTTNRGIRERLSELVSAIAKGKRFDAQVCAELIEPESSMPTKLEKHKRKLGFKS